MNILLTIFVLFSFVVIIMMGLAAIKAIEDLKARNTRPATNDQINSIKDLSRIAGCSTIDLHELKRSWMKAQSRIIELTNELRRK